LKHADHACLATHISDITDALVSLHACALVACTGTIQFKIAVLTYRVLHGDAPRYLGPFTSTADVPRRRVLRSVGTNRLVVPPVRLSTVGSRVFPVAAAQIWTLYRNTSSQLPRCSPSGVT